MYFLVKKGLFIYFPLFSLLIPSRYRITIIIDTVNSMLYMLVFIVIRKFLKLAASSIERVNPCIIDRATI